MSDLHLQRGLQGHCEVVTSSVDVTFAPVCYSDEFSLSASVHGKNRRMNDLDELSTWTQGWHTVRISTRDQVLTEQASNLHVVLPGNLFANLGGPYTPKAEVSDFTNNFLHSHLSTAHIHSGLTVFLHTLLTLFYIHDPHTLPTNHSERWTSFWV